MCKSNAMCALLTALCAAVVFLCVCRPTYPSMSGVWDINFSALSRYVSWALQQLTHSAKHTAGSSSMSESVAQSSFSCYLLWSVLVTFFGTYSCRIYRKPFPDVSHRAPAIAAFNTGSRPVAPPPFPQVCFPFAEEGEGVITREEAFFLSLSDRCPTSVFTLYVLPVAAW